jgi:hypothetical protein
MTMRHQVSAQEAVFRGLRSQVLFRFLFLVCWSKGDLSHGAIMVCSEQPISGLACQVLSVNKGINQGPWVVLQASDEQRSRLINKPSMHACRPIDKCLVDGCGTYFHRFCTLTAEKTHFLLVAQHL